MAEPGKDQLGRRLLQIKEELEKKKTQRSELQGELKSLMGQLKDLGIETIEQAETCTEEWEKELQGLEKTIREGIKEIEELMNNEHSNTSTP